MKLSKAEQTVLRKLKALLSRRSGLHQLILFGSRARREAIPDSDMDVLVVWDGILTWDLRDFISDCSWEAGFDNGIVVVSVPFSREEWESGPERYSLLAQAIAREGVPV